jgi:translation initiation factor 2 gamma subunit (eIF-2gamma)
MADNEITKGDFVCARYTGPDLTRGDFLYGTVLEIDENEIYVLHRVKCDTQQVRKIIKPLYPEEEKVQKAVKRLLD